MASTKSPKACVQCGAELFDDARFCVVCGTPVLNERPKIEAVPPASKSTRSARSRRRATSVGLAPPSQPPAVVGAQPSAGGALRKPPPPRSSAKPAARPPPAPSKTNHGSGGSVAGATASGAATSITSAGAQPRAKASSVPNLTLTDIDDSFDAILGNPSAEATGGTEHDQQEVESLFRQIARAYLGPVRELAIELGMGEASQSWLGLCSPAVKSLQKAAKDMTLATLAEALENFSLALTAAEQDGARAIAGKERERLLETYKALEQAMPEAFAVEGEGVEREGVIVQSLLQQVPGLRKVALDKIYAAGLTSLSMFYAATAEELVQTTGIALELAERVVECFRQYRERASQIPPDAGHAADREKIASLARVLSEQSDAFDRLSKSWAADAAKDKRRVRREREETVLEVNVVLARLGEVELVKELERAPFSRKIALLSSYLETAEKKLADARGDR